MTLIELYIYISLTKLSQLLVGFYLRIYIISTNNISFSDRWSQLSLLARVTFQFVVEVHSILNSYKTEQYKNVSNSKADLRGPCPPFKATFLVYSDFYRFQSELS